MRGFNVTWELGEIESESPKQAAIDALRVQRDSESLATYFEVTDVDTGEVWAVDLHENTVELIKPAHR